MSCKTILSVLKQKKEGVVKDYYKFILSSNIDEYLESKEDNQNLGKALVIILIPLFLLLSVFILIK
jgi:3D (Asp-Asp-Asp) domain-containing protein